MVVRLVMMSDLHGRVGDGFRLCHSIVSLHPAACSNGKSNGCPHRLHNTILMQFVNSRRASRNDNYCNLTYISQDKP